MGFTVLHVGYSSTTMTTTAANLLFVQDNQVREQFDAVDYCHSVLFNGTNHSEIPLPLEYGFIEFPFKVRLLLCLIEEMKSGECKTMVVIAVNKLILMQGCIPSLHSISQSR